MMAGCTQISQVPRGQGERDGKYETEHWIMSTTYRSPSSDQYAAKAKGFGQFRFVNKTETR